MCLGIPGQVVEILDSEQQRAVADVDGVRREISVSLLGVGGDEGIDVGDWVLIHVGFAMAKIDEQEAADTLEVLKLMGSAYDDEIAQYRSRWDDEESPQLSDSGVPSDVT